LLLKLSRLRSRLALLVLSILMVLTATQFSPYAFAQDIEDEYHCSPEWYVITVKTGKSLDVQYRCEPRMEEFDLRVWRWTFFRFVPAGEDKRVGAVRRSSSPPYTMEITGLVGRAQGGGAAGGRIFITNPDGSNLDRRLAVRTIMEYRPSGSSVWSNCRDNGWVESPKAASAFATYINNFTQPNCGTGYYRTQVAGRFWSISQNNWITSLYHYTAAIYIVCTDPSCQ
jgi:hypothetical protein